MAIVGDWIKQTVSGTPGTGSITLGVAVGGFIAIGDDTRISDGSLVHYSIEDGSNRERGVGTYSTTGPTLARTTIHAKLESGAYSESPGTGLSLTSGAIVYISVVARSLNFNGALSYNSAAFTMSVNAAWTDITWNSDSYDTLALHDTGSNTARMTVPPGVTRVRLIGNAEMSNINATGVRAIRFYKNGTGVAAGTSEVQIPAVAAVQVLYLSTPVLTVLPGDYFTMQYYQSSGVTTGTIGANATDGSISYFAMEIVE